MRSFIGLVNQYLLAKKALADFVPSNLDIIKKEILQGVVGAKDSVENVHLYVIGRDKNRSPYMETSIEGTIMECLYPIDCFLRWDLDKLTVHTSGNWSLSTKVRYHQEPIKDIYFENIVKITAKKTVLYEKNNKIKRANLC